MQNKGLIKLFAFLFGLVSIYQLSYTFIASKIERDAEVYAANQISEAEENYVSKREELEVRYLDSIGSNPILGYTSYDEAKKKNRKMESLIFSKFAIAAGIIKNVAIKNATIAKRTFENGPAAKTLNCAFSKPFSALVLRTVPCTNSSSLFQLFIMIVYHL